MCGCFLRLRQRLRAPSSSPPLFFPAHLALQFPCQPAGASQPGDIRGFLFFPTRVFVTCAVSRAFLPRSFCVRFGTAPLQTPFFAPPGNARFDHRSCSVAGWSSQVRPQRVNAGGPVPLPAFLSPRQAEASTGPSRSSLVSSSRLFSRRASFFPQSPGSLVRVRTQVKV